MFLNRLEIVGFKSFAERVKIQFNNGITGVVGPNGSGKSNIIDAIRWVLGEQSARSLRGQKMEDIIFQGSDTRKALNFAEVALVLNNDDNQLPIDYDEVSIVRRVYRSGDSEFYINKQACRLKDIVDLFTDTGLGKESFSIIGQGKIDEILSSKAEERRAIFEEAAGVLKYKQRKLKAEHKLSETEDNLLRVDDIVHEIQTQLEPLKEQADKAKTYKMYKKQLEEVEVSLLITEIEQLHDKWQELLSIIEKEKEEEFNLQTEINKEEAIVEANRQKIHQYEEELNDLQSELLSLTEQVKNLEGKRNVMLERYKHMAENKSTYIEQLEAAKNKQAELNEMLTSEQSKHIDLLKEKTAIDQAIKQVDYMLNHGVDDIETEIESLKSDYIERLNERAVNDNELSSLKAQLEKLKTDQSEDNESYQSYQEEEKVYQAKVARIEQRLNDKDKEIEKFTDLAEEYKSTFVKETKELEEMQVKLYQGNEQIAKLVSRLETLEEMKESYQGYFFSVKEILKAHKQGKLVNIHGTVVDLIKVEKDYITAIDTTLGGQAQYVVTEDEQAARHAINWLKSENKGRATFLPLNKIQSRFVPQQVVNELKNNKGFVALASDLVQTENRFKTVIQHLLGHIIVAKDLKSATELAQLSGRKYRIVTLEGDVINPGGAMSGGARKKTDHETLFTRDSELKELRKKVSDFKKRAKDFANQLTEKEASIATLNDKIKEIEETLSEHGEEKAVLEEEYRNMKSEFTRIQSDLSLFATQDRQYREQIEQIEQNIFNKTKNHENIIEEINTIESNIERLTEEVATFNEERRHKEAEKHELDKKQIEFEQNLKHVSLRIEELESQADNYHEQIFDLKEKLTEIEKLENEAQNESNLAANIETLKEDRQQKLQLIDEKRHLRQSYREETDDLMRELKEKEKIHQKKVQFIQEKEIEASRLDVQLETRLNHLQTEYVTSFERASKEYEKVDNIQDAKAEVQAIKQRINRLGTVNLGAIEEYDRLTERYTFLEEQKTDLLEAKATLHAVIQEMDEEMVKRFGEVFGDIQIAFSDVFKKLFGGGHAELILTDENNLLETGIEIIASPPGKKQKALSLLSGGERALTAIALLFAILRVKPVPFCILDEVDASLDEANVARFANYLNHYSDGSQFIVITHRKGTMEEANVLYGVTMQESGVSRLVSVRLEDAEDLIDVN